MAVVRSPRSSPPYALILFIFLWVVSTGLAVFLFVQNGKITTEKDTIIANDAAIFAKPSDRDSTTVRDLIGLGKKSGRGAMGEAINQVGELKSRIASGGSNMPYEEIVQKIDATRAEVSQRDTALLSAMQALNSLAKQNADRAADLDSKLQASQAQFAAAKKTYDDASATAGKTNDDRKGEVDKINAELDTLRAANDATVKKYEAEKTKLLADQDAAQRDLVVKIQQAQEEANRLRGQVKLFTDRLNLMSPGVKTTLADEPDGVIIRTNLQTGEVWINLGRKDHVSPGQTFAVYDPRTGVHTTTLDEAKGKGGIEVTEVGENQSTCRITHTEKGVTFQANDLIANPIYNKDKNRKYHFVVYGDFDLDNDGIATPAKKEKLVHLVQSWGGIVDDKVTAQTDFVVIGAMPGSSTTAYPVQTEQTADLLKARKDQQDEYSKMIAAAKDFSIPVLNANRFLAMIGYYNTTVVRY